MNEREIAWSTIRELDEVKVMPEEILESIAKLQAFKMGPKSYMATKEQIEELKQHVKVDNSGIRRIDGIEIITPEEAIERHFKKSFKQLMRGE